MLGFQDYCKLNLTTLLPKKYSVALAIRTKRIGRDNVLLVQRPTDDKDFPGKWGLPAASCKNKELIKIDAVNVAEEKLGVRVTLGTKLASGTQKRDDHILEMTLYDAWLPEQKINLKTGEDCKSKTFYTDFKWGKPTELTETAEMGSLCSRLLIQNSKKRIDLQKSMKKNSTLTFSWDCLPMISHEVNGTGGSIRATLEDFMVEEIPSYTPSGTGDHLFAFIKKHGVSTNELLQELKTLGIPSNQVGIAGMKDKYSISKQWISIPKSSEHALDYLNEKEKIEIIKTSYHTNKLGIGHLIGNNFSIRVRNTNKHWKPLAEASIELLNTFGMPNYFGPQRFGKSKNNAQIGLEILRGNGPKLNKRLSRLFTDSLQSFLFNANLAHRINSDMFNVVLKGDFAKKHDTGGVFLVENETLESDRSKKLQISSLLPLFGRKTRLSDHNAGEIENQIMEELGIVWSEFANYSTGFRRISRVKLNDINLIPEIDGYTIIFTLPKGSFATCMLREIMKTTVDIPS